MRRKTILCITFVVIALVLAAAALYVVREWRIQQRYREMARQVQSEAQVLSTQPPAPVELPEETQAPAAPTPEPTPEQTPEPTPEPVSIPIDFPYYCEQNDDIVGWVEVEGTDIDYLVLYDTDNYYLNHTYQYQYSGAGSIFMQDYNHSDFSDFNTVLYGHNMASGAMFAQLHRFEKSDFFDAHDTITIYTPDRRLTYRIFAAYKTDNLNIMTHFDYSTEEGREEYIDRIYTHTYSHFDEDVPVTASDRIITLSTCIGNSNYRYVVQGVLVEERAGICE